MKRDGDLAEDQALSHLLARGCHLRERNFRCRFGEIDLIVADGGTLVFVEVRKRSHTAFGNAADSITPSKQRRIVAAARFYLSGRQVDAPCRFDAVLIDGAGRVEWMRDAFGA